MSAQPNQPAPQETPWLEIVRQQVATVTDGSVEIHIRNASVVQIDTKERTQLENTKTSSRKAQP